jgi:hypothetical protein
MHKYYVVKSKLDPSKWAVRGSSIQKEGYIPAPDGVGPNDGDIIDVLEETDAFGKITKTAVINQERKAARDASRAANRLAFQSEQNKKKLAKDRLNAIDTSKALADQEQALKDIIEILKG